MAKGRIGKIIVHPETGEENTVSGWAKNVGVSRAGMYKRLAEWPLVEALSQEPRFFYQKFETSNFSREELILTRKKIGMTQKQIADFLEMGYSSYVRMESGARPVKKVVFMAVKYYWVVLYRRNTVGVHYYKKQKTPDS